MRAVVATALLAGCFAPDRALLEVPVTLVVDATPPPSVRAWDLDRVHVSVADLVLREADGVVGAWAGLRPVDGLAPPAPVGIVQVYAGVVDGAAFAITGAAPLARVAGRADVGGTLVPFDLEITAPVDVDGVRVALEVSEETPPDHLAWTLDLAVATDLVAWGRVRAGDPTAADALARGLANPEAWSIAVAEPGAP